ncbi:PucR family transcriptional regulator [Oceanobacter kriegii]|uniref:PucR family transcriptional regulator n=1 Tax=Oceanobacter kriegii TaxID=64972 RepID=UPI00042321C3|nr:PucR family transcriptional regulator ligand-binding domain-containing protein [Oceanobacter kriegii]
MSISCADIPHLPGLGTIRLRAGFQGANRIVRWPYIAENESITPWVSGGELVFVTGINLPRNEADLCRLVEEGHQQHIAGIVVLTGEQYIREIPASVLELANHLQFPLFEQPYELKMVLVTETISNAIVQDNLMGQSVKLFLSKLINGFAETPELIHLRARQLGLSDQRPYAVLAVRMVMPASSHPDEQALLLQQRHHLEQQLTDLIKRRHIDWPVLVHEQDLLTLWPSDDHRSATLYEEISDAFLRLQQHSNIALYAGVSDLQDALGQLSVAVEQARQSVQFALQHQHQRLFFYDQLGIARLFAAIPQRQMLSEFCQQQLGALCFCRDPQSLQLKETLTQYLNLFGNQQQAAEALGIHRNTLVYRLKRIEADTGLSLKDPFTRLNLQNALLIEQILFQHHSIDHQTPHSTGTPTP